MTAIVVVLVLTAIAIVGATVHAIVTDGRPPPAQPKRY